MFLFWKITLKSSQMADKLFANCKQIFLRCYIFAHQALGEILA